MNEERQVLDIRLPKFLFNPLTWIVALVVIGFAGYTIANRPAPQTSTEGDLAFKALCIEDKGEGAWMKMKPMKEGKILSENTCWGCMVDNNNMICDKSEYEKKNNENKSISS